MDKETLKRKAEAVRELKSQYYIGTSEAKAYLDAFDLVDTMPTEWANKTCENWPEIEYKPTPEKIVGLSYVIDELTWNRNLDEIGLEHLGYTYVGSYLARGTWHASFYTRLEDLAFFGITDWEAVSDTVKKKGEITEMWFGNYLFGSFLGVNNSGDFSDYNLLDVSLSILLEELRHKTLRPKDEFDEAAEHIKKELAVSFSGLSLDTVLVREREKYNLKLRATMSIDWHEIFLKIQKDMVDHRLEYRRQVALLYAKQRGHVDGDEAIASTKEIAGAFGRIESSFSRLIPILVSERKFLNRILKD